jgi:holo-[acyl-carrier protein] synthase
MNIDIGTDIVSLSRIKAAMDRHGDTFIHRLFTQKEIGFAKKLANPLPFYAGRYAAKEAIAKALGTGFGEKLTWLDIEILKEPSGKPTASLSPKASHFFKHPKLKISISHEKENAIAFALISVL